MHIYCVLWVVSLNSLILFEWKYKPFAKSSLALYCDLRLEIKCYIFRTFVVSGFESKWFFFNFFMDKDDWETPRYVLRASYSLFLVNLFLVNPFLCPLKTPENFFFLCFQGMQKEKIFQKLVNHYSSEKEMLQNYFFSVLPNNLQLLKGMLLIIFECWLTFIRGIFTKFRIVYYTRSQISKYRQVFSKTRLGHCFCL